MSSNCSQFGITEFGYHDHRQGIIHVIGPEQGATLPGMTVVAGDSHTSTHGAFAALAFALTVQPLYEAALSTIEATGGRGVHGAAAGAGAGAGRAGVGRSTQAIDRRAAVPRTLRLAPFAIRWNLTTIPA